MDKFTGLEAFVAVVDEGTFTGAAAALGVSKSYVSKRVSALENRLGARLLNRTTRSTSLTSAGRAFYDRCVQILEQVDEAERAVMQLHTQPRGLLRMSVPFSFGLRYLSTAIAEFLETHGDLEIDVDFTDRRVDLVAEGLDLVVRIGRLEDSSHAFKKLGTIHNVLCASPSFVESHGVPRSPDDLDPEHCLAYAYQTSTTLKFRRGEEERFVRPSGRLRANNGEALLDACLQGIGVAQMPTFFVSEHLHNGTLVSLLDDWIDDDGRGIWALYPHSRHLTAKVRHFVDFLADRLDPPPWELPAKQTTD